MNILILDTLAAEQYGTFYTPAVMEKLNALGTVSYMKYDRKSDTAMPELIRQIRDVDVLFCNWGVPDLGEEFYEAANKLKVIAYTGGSVGDLANESLKKRENIVLLSGNNYFAESVAQGTICYMLMGQRRLYQTLKGTEQQGWWKAPYSDGLRGKTVGLVSFGMIAKHVARMLQVFDCKVKVYSSHGLSREDIEKYNVEECSLEELFRTSDIVSVHSGMTPKTYHMVNDEMFSIMKPNALIVNTARGAVIDESAMEKYAAAGKIRAVLDVFEVEPLPADSKLRGLDNVIIVPHCGGPTTDVRGLLTLALIDDAVRACNGEKNLENQISMEYAKNMTSHKMVASNSESKKNH